MRYLTKEQIIRLNRDTVREHGGNFIPPHNFLHEEYLDYLLDAVKATLFGESMYPSVADKAAVYCYTIICNHVFSDGNKRTGLGAALNFLLANGWQIKLSVQPEAVTSYILQVASGQSSLEACRAWFAANAVRL